MDKKIIAEKLKREIENQKNYYPVIVDGNRHNLGVCVTTKKELITLKKCQEICKKVEEHFEIKVKTIDVMMTQYDYKHISIEDYESALYGDCGIGIVGKQKTAQYNNITNCLLIWEDGLPVYENNNGLICNDPNTLADCLC